MSADGERWCRCLRVQYFLSARPKVCRHPLSPRLDAHMPRFIRDTSDDGQKQNDKLPPSFVSPPEERASRTKATGVVVRIKSHACRVRARRIEIKAPHTIGLDTSDWGTWRPTRGCASKSKLPTNTPLIADDNTNLGSRSSYLSLTKGPRESHERTRERT